MFPATLIATAALETTHMFTRRRTNQQECNIFMPWNTIQPYKCTNSSCSNHMDESEKQNVAGKKQDSKGYILYNDILKN